MGEPPCSPPAAPPTAQSTPHALSRIPYAVLLLPMVQDAQSRAPDVWQPVRGRSASSDCAGTCKCPRCLSPPPVSPFPGFFPLMTSHTFFQTLGKLPSSSAPVNTAVCHLSLASPSCSMWIWTKWFQSPAITQERLSAGRGGSLRRQRPANTQARVGTVTVAIVGGESWRRGLAEGGRTDPGFSPRHLSQLCY